MEVKSGQQGRFPTRARGTAGGSDVCRYPVSEKKIHIEHQIFHFETHIKDWSLKCVSNYKPSITAILKILAILIILIILQALAILIAQITGQRNIPLLKRQICGIMCISRKNRHEAYSSRIVEPYAMIDDRNFI